MLVLSRKANETIVIGANIQLRVLAIKGNVVRLGIEAPRTIRIRRSELATRLLADLATEMLAENAMGAVASDVHPPLAGC